MLRARPAVGLCTAAAVALAGGLAFGSGEGDAPRAATASDCRPAESTYTSDSLHDVRSFSDAMAIVTAVKEETSPPPGGPEGYAGLIGRAVTIRVERVLWRRPHAPRPPATARFDDLGWWGEPDDRVPMVVCGQTRMELGRRYLAPIVRQHGQWYPFFTVRLLLDGDRVVGGVDGGEPNNAHHALAGRSVAGAVRLVARTPPYRAVVLHPEGSPARRWQAVDRDRYRIWRRPHGERRVVASGVTASSRWQVYMRLPRRGGLCTGMTVRPLWRGFPSPRGETCRGRRIGAESVTLAIFSGHARGQFAFGRAGRRVWAVRVRFGDGPSQRVDTLPAPLAIRDRFWVVPSEDECRAISVQALGRGDRVLSRIRSPYAAC